MARAPLVIALQLIAAPALADDIIAPASRAHAVRRTTPVAIDGRLDEAAWHSAPKQSGFTQRFPSDGVKASFETRFAVLYDDSAIYVGVWADDPEPHKIRRLLTRRDVDAPADTIMVGIDSYRDRRTAYTFQLNAAGVQRDQLLFDDTQGDDKWDAVWTGDVAVTATGWTAEFKIPLNQLRFTARDANEWGLQVVRIIGRTQEQAVWSPWPRSSAETVSKFGVVAGIDHIGHGRRLELLPYASGGFESMPVEQGDPLNDRVAGLGNLGLDLKYGLGPAFTLSATINPDFGQVEADPSQINLTGNELFFAEKRPFFLEGSDLFKLPIGNKPTSVEGVFYSRRIGAAPPVEPDDYDYIDMPASTTIYGAAKLTGKTRGGWSVGVLDAVTGGERARIVDSAGETSEPIVAPLTNYAIARVKRDLRGGKTAVGGSATAVHRALEGTGLDGILHDQAYTLGTQLQHRWADNAWELTLSTIGSYVHGSEAAIARTQRAQRHLFQRPDASHVHLDPTSTSMSGAGMTWKVGRTGDTRRWRYMFGGDLRTAGLELNDAGFQLISDRVVPFLWAQYHDEQPGEHVLNSVARANAYLLADELAGDPRIVSAGVEWDASLQLASYWQLGTWGDFEDLRWSSSALRGGPSLRLDRRITAAGWVHTDKRRPVWVSVNATGVRTPKADAIQGTLDAGVTVQARSNIDVFVGPSWSYRIDPLQYVDEAADAAGTPHYVFARIRQTTAAMTFRMNWTLSPRLSLQAYAQPFIASASYSEFKDVTNPRAERFEDRFDRLDGSKLSLMDGTYSADNGGVFSFARPDFNFRQLRSSLVVRWEYRPGSSVFAIWSHGRTSEDDDGSYRLGRDLSRLGDAEGENLVMVKANYWIGL